MLGLFSKKVSPEEPVETVEPVQPVDKRQCGRRGIYTDIQVMTAGGAEPRNGIVLDLSAHGARLRLLHGDRFVDGMILKIPRYGLTIPARVRWAGVQDIGVEFVA